MIIDDIHQPAPSSTFINTPVDPMIVMEITNYQYPHTPSLKGKENVTLYYNFIFLMLREKEVS